MPTEGTFLLAGILIFFAAMGWLWERLGRERDKQPPARISADYIRGLNLVLNRKTDEALELFIQIAKVDDETLETHFALGHLFRRRGEVDRAIRVHQNLLARPSLSEAQRHQSLFALAEDYLSAGLFDRAETLFAELTSSQSLARQALERLLDIYEREREWEKAIDTHRQLEERTGDTTTRAAHYLCELAERARLEGDTDKAREYLDETAERESGGLRAVLIRAAIAQAENRPAEAVALYQQVIAADPRFIAEVLPDLLAGYRETDGIERFDEFVRQLVARSPGIEKELAFAAIIGDLTDSQALSSCVESFVMGNAVLAKLIDIDELRTASAEKRHAAIARIVRGLRELALSSARYRCTNCGYSSRRLLWQCPSCKHWDSVRPVQNFQYSTLVS